MYLVQSFVVAFVVMMLDSTFVDAMDGVVSFSNFLTVFVQDAAALSFPPAEIRIDTDINLVHNKSAPSLISANTTR